MKQVPETTEEIRQLGETLSTNADFCESTLCIIPEITERTFREAAAEKAGENTEYTKDKVEKT